MFLFCAPFFLYAQNNDIAIKAVLAQDHKIIIEQEITFHNPSEDVLDTIYLLNWANGYRDKKTPLNKRLIENYDRSLYFAKIKERGYSSIKLLQCDQQDAAFEEVPDASDLVRVILPASLLPKDSVKIHLSYEVKVPSDRFTRYGHEEVLYNLRYWYITPAVYDGQWHLFSNLNMDDYYMQPTNFTIDFAIPHGYTLHTDLNEEVQIKEDHVRYSLKGANRQDIELSIQLNNDFSVYKTEGMEIITNIPSKNLTENVKDDVLQRQLNFIEGFLGRYPHSRILISMATYMKAPVYGFNQLPKSLNPFSDIFEWDIKMFKALTHRYIENTILTNPREDNWLADGIQILLMMEYVQQYYPEVKAIGNISKRWGIRRYNIAKLDFNGKYPMVYQFSARKQLDQSLTTRADSLSNLNLKLVNRYKSGMGLRYLANYLNDDVIKSTLQDYYAQNALTLSKTVDFKTMLLSRTTKDLNWFFKDYMTTNNKINYTIDKIKETKDSVQLTIKNKSNFAAPMALYGIDKKDIKFKQWIPPVEDKLTLTVPTAEIDRLNLNYEKLIPEENLRDNWKKLNKKLLNRPLKVTFYKDVEDPYYNQIFYKPFIGYNLYDGLQLGPTIYNQAMFKKKWLFTVTPVYGFTSKTITGAAGFAYEHLPQETSVYRYRAGLNAGKSHYNNDLTFNKMTPYFRVDFKRKSLRDIGGNSLLTRYVMVDKELPPGVVDSETYVYNVLDLRYASSHPDLINDFRYFTDFQYNNDFSKVSLDLRYRKLTNINRHVDFRVFFGAFLYNDTNSDFFSYSIDRPTDYLFDLNYLARSESSGFLSQQIIITEGGFKSIFNDPYANDWILTTNASIGIWRWIEFYADAGFLKNQNEAARFKYDTGIRLNFIPEFLEFYFPLQSSLGFEPGLSDYASRIRFVLTINFESIYNYIKRGFY